jgi:hypothetical protein
MKKIDFVNSLLNKKGADFITFSALTEVKVNKSAVIGGIKQTNPFFGRIAKESTVNAQINFNYENAVNNRREKEGSDRDFQTAGLKWGNKNHNNSIVYNNGQWYLQVRVLKGYGTRYFVDGKETPKSEIEAYLPVKKEGSGRQGVEDEIIIRTYKLDNINSITMNGSVVQIEDRNADINAALLQRLPQTN